MVLISRWGQVSVSCLSPSCLCGPGLLRLQEEGRVRRLLRPKLQEDGALPLRQENELHIAVYRNVSVSVDNTTQSGLRACTDRAQAVSRKLFIENLL